VNTYQSSKTGTQQTMILINQQNDFGS